MMISLLLEKVSPLRQVCKNIKLYPFNPDDKAKTNPSKKETELSGVRILSGEEFSFSKVDALRV